MSANLPKNACFNVSPEMLASLVGCPEWDILLVGDGSGTGGWTMAGGWACAIIERETDERSVCWAGWSLCDILVAELSAYLQALMQIEALRGKALRRHLGRPIKILIVTDNQAIATQASAALSGRGVGGGTNPIWAAIRQIVQSTGTSLMFRFAPRRSTMLNVLVDQVAGRLRRIVSDSESGQCRTEGSSTRSLKSRNPRNL